MSLAVFRRQFSEAQQLREAYGQTMTRTPTLEDAGPLRRALAVLLACERGMVTTYRSAASGRLELSAEELQLFLDVLDTIASTYDDLHDAPNALRYFKTLIEYDKCSLTRKTNATLEYEYCSGRLFSRSIILSRHGLKRPDLAKQMYSKAASVSFNGERVHWWPDEWQVPTLYMKGLRSQAYWEQEHGIPLAAVLEENFALIRDEFRQVLAHPRHGRAFTQNDHALIAAGTWGELKLYDGKEWKPPCSGPASGTCRLLSRQMELVGTFPHARTHNVNLPKEAAYFQLLPGSRLKPHTGPVNFHLYCHLGLLVPDGPRLRVGAGPPRRWAEGRTLCFDDSFEHEAWHDGSEPRYVLMVTFWHPDLGTPEKDHAAPRLPKTSRRKRVQPQL